MTTENTSAIGTFYDDVAEYFATVDPGVSVQFGAIARWEQLNQGTGGANRIVIVPGRLPDGDDGDVDAAPGPGEHIDPDTHAIVPRMIAAQPRFITISVWAAADGATPSARERHEVLEQLIERTLRAGNHSLANLANGQWGRGRYNRNPAELRFGDEYLLEIVIETQWLDSPPVAVFPAAANVGRNPPT